MITHYQILKGPSEGLYKEKGSKFYSYGYPIQTVSDVDSLLVNIKSRHPKARHHCYAYRLGTDGMQFRSVDDGEPSGTAGKPILGQIDSAKITNTLIVVVRYFGGTLLGASGLIRAYKESAAQAIRKNQIVQVEITRKFKIHFDFSIMGKLLYAIAELQIPVLEKNLEMSPYVTIELSADKADSLLDQLISRSLRIHIETIIGSRTFEQLTIEEC